MYPTRTATHGLPDPDLQPEFYSSVAMKRFIAWLVDLLIVGVMVGLIVMFTLFIGLFFLPFVWLAIDFMYRTITLANHSSTWGQRLMGIEFRDRTGRRFDLVQAAIGTAGYLLATSAVIPQLISVILVMTTARRQSLVDLLMGTAAINRPATPL